MENPITRPAADEYAPFYRGYVDQVPSDQILQALRLSAFDTVVFLENLPAGKWDFRYGPGKWTIGEAMLHVIDTERIFAYRALRIARGDSTPLPGFDQDAYVPESGAARRSPESIIAEFRAVREATLQLFENLDPVAWGRSGTASGHPVSVRALAFIIAGHEHHHRRIMVERYL